MKYVKTFEAKNNYKIGDLLVYGDARRLCILEKFDPWDDDLSYMIKFVDSGSQIWIQGVYLSRATQKEIEEYEIEKSIKNITYEILKKI